MAKSRHVVHSGELTRLIGNDLHLVGNEPSNDELFSGLLRWYRLRSGLSVHCSDCYELHNFATEVAVGPQISFILFLDGHSDVTYGDRRLSIGAQDARRCAPRGAAVVLAEPVLFSRQAQRGKHIRKISVSLSPEWFEAGGFDGHKQLRELIDLRRDHLSVHHWQPSARLLVLAEQMLKPPAENPLLTKLYQESRALEIASEALALLCGHAGATPAPESLRPHEHQRIRRTLELLNSDIADSWSLEQIAREVGVNVNTLQRQFQATQGMSLYQYQRRRKLLQAREALERQGVSVQQAAWLAGYGSAANFATAFKRAFGVSPKQIRTRL